MTVRGWISAWLLGGLPNGHHALVNQSFISLGQFPYVGIMACFVMAGHFREVSE